MGLSVTVLFSAVCGNCRRLAVRFRLALNDISRPVATLAVLIGVSSVVGQAQVSPEFRTAPRSLITEKVDRSRVTQVPGAVNPRLARYADLGEARAELPLEHIQLVLQRPPERQAAFDAEVQALHTPGSTSFHQWLTPALVGSEFGLSASDVTTIISYLEAEGFTVNFVGKSSMFIDFTGTAAQVEHSFKTNIHQVQGTDGVTRYAAMTEASLPSALTPAIAGFFSLSNIPVARPMMKHKVKSAKELKASLEGKPANTVSMNAEYDVGPQDFYTIYNENPLLSESINGTGATVAQLEETDLANPGDVTTFRTMFNVVPNAPSLTIAHGYGSITCGDPAVTSTDEEAEAMLDTEWAGAAAPGAMLLYMACASTTTAGIFLSAEAVIDNNLADTMSLSYGENETNNAGELSVINLWEQAAAQGETVVVSAGDSGSDAEDEDEEIATHGLNVNGFSSTNYNVSAGGTDFQDGYNYLETESGTPSAYGYSAYWDISNGTGYSSAKKYVPEIPWNETCASSQFSYYLAGATKPTAGCDALIDLGYVTPLGGGGGGPSEVTDNARATWQNGTVYGLPSTGTNANRLQPDLSLFASSGFWGHGLDYYQSDVSTSLEVAGGTSFVAPQLAGMFALITQKTGARLGQPNFVLYAMAGKAYGTGTFSGTGCSAGATSGIDTNDAPAPASSCIFNDIEWGNNSQECEAGTADCYYDVGGEFEVGILSTSTNADNPAYAGGKGYDLATGLGSVNIYNLVNNWQSTTESTLYTPTVTLAQSVASGNIATYGTADILTATVTGSGSYPTGTVTFAGTPAVTVGLAALIGSYGTTGTGTCAVSSPCTSTASVSIYPAITANDTTYTIKASYSSTAENYVSGAVSGTVSVTVVGKATPVLTVPNVTASYGDGDALLTATLAFGSGAAPTGAVKFAVTGGSTVAGTCTGTTSPLSCSILYPVPTGTYPAGNYTITVSDVGDTNYNAAATKTATLTIGTYAPTLAFTTASPQYSMFPTVPLTTTTNSSGALTYSVTSGPAAISMTTPSDAILMGAAGTVDIKVTQAQSPSYGASSTTGSFVVKVGSVWVGNGSDTVSAFDLGLGTAITTSPGLGAGYNIGTIPLPLGEAFDASGNFWLTSSEGVTKFALTAAGPTPTTSTPITAGGISFPVGLAIDGLGQVWVANDNGTISGLTSAAAAITPTTGYTASGVAALYTNLGGIAVDLSGNLWITNSADGSVTQVIGVAAPVAPLSTSLANGTTGTQP
jgi:hypothetical protein